MGNHHWKKIAAVMLAAAIGIQPVCVQAKTREEIQQEREQKKSEQQGTQSQYKQSQSKVSRTLWRKKYRSWIPNW